MNTYFSINQVKNFFSVDNKNYTVISVKSQKEKSKFVTVIAKILVPNDLVELCKNSVLDILQKMSKYANCKISFEKYKTVKTNYLISSLFLGTFKKLRDIFQKTKDLLFDSIQTNEVLQPKTESLPSELPQIEIDNFESLEKPKTDSKPKNTNKPRNSNKSKNTNNQDTKKTNKRNSTPKTDSLQPVESPKTVITIE